MGTEMQVWTLDALERAAAYIVRSGLFGVKRTEEAVALMLLAQAEGLHPMRAVQEYHIINGRPALRADAMLARFLQAGGRVEWHTLTDERAEATFSHPQGGSVRIAWTLEDAKRAGLIQKPGSNWDKYPRAMLRARVVSEGVRTVYPGVVVGVYTPEEVADFAAAEAEAQQAEVVQLPPPGSGGGNGHKEVLAAIKAQADALGLSRETVRVLASRIAGREVGSARELTEDEAEELLTYLDALASEEGLPPEEWGRRLVVWLGTHGEGVPFPDELKEVAHEG